MRRLVSAVICAAALAAGAKESVVFVGAHPDDSEGFAATAFLLRDRYDVHVVDLTRGELGLGPSGLEDATTACRRTKEEREACAFLGAKVHFLSEVDGDACAGEKSVARLAALFAELKPRAVFTHWPVDAHSDHVQTAATVVHALRRSGVRTERYFYEVLLRQTQNFVPLYWVDVTKTMADKQRMLRFYECQNRNDELVRQKTDQALLRGRQRRPAVRYAETFTTYDGARIEGGVLEELAETVADPGRWDCVFSANPVR